MAEKDRLTIIDRANRMLKQSQTLRKVSDELLQESKDLRSAAKGIKRKPEKTSRSGRG